VGATAEEMPTSKMAEANDKILSSPRDSTPKTTQDMHQSPSELRSATPRPGLPTVKKNALLSMGGTVICFVITVIVIAL
jgi:hypothetical protein